MDGPRTAGEKATEQGLSVHFSLEPDDMRAFMAHNRKHSSQWKRLRWLIVLVAIALIFDRANHRPDESIAGFLIYVILYIGLFWVCLLAVRWFTQRRMFTVQQQPGFFCEHTITLFDDALFEETPVNRSEHRWAGIHHIAEGPRHIFIFIAANAAHVIPKRAFADTAAERTFFGRAQELFHRAHPATVK
jgi:hypothetical protein